VLTLFNAADVAARALARLWIFRHDDFTAPSYTLRRGEDGTAGRFGVQRARLDESLGVTFDEHPAVTAWLERPAERPAIAPEAPVVAGR